MKIVLLLKFDTVLLRNLTRSHQLEGENSVLVFDQEIREEIILVPLCGNNWG